MKYLNNPINGNVIRINKISDNGIYYSIYENSILANQKFHSIDKRIDNLLNAIEVTELGPFEIIEYNTALKLILECETNFVVNEDERNWYISSENGTFYRVFIPNKAYDNALRDKDTLNSFYNPLWQVINYGTINIESKYSQITDFSIVLYLEELYDEHRQVLEMYINDGVIIESKI